MTNGSSTNSAKHYWAFISYSHSDREWADWLHKSLEKYRVPRKLVGMQTRAGLVPARLAPIFLDHLELAAASDLDTIIAEALSASRSMVVICSPAAAGSPRVSQEIESFRVANSGPLLSLIVSGRPSAEERGANAADECFPTSLRVEQPTTNQLTVPLAADVRAGKGGRQEALLKLVAGILGLNLDLLRQREAQRRRLRWAASSATFAVGMICTTLLASFAIHERDSALHSQSLLLTQVAAQSLKDGDFSNAQGLILEVLSNRAFAKARSPAAISVFQEVRAADPVRTVLSGHNDSVSSAVCSPDGKLIVTASRDRSARLWDLTTGIQLAVLSGHTGTVSSAAFSPDGANVVTASFDKTARVWRVKTGAAVVTLSGHTDRVSRANYSPDGKHIVTASYDKTARIWDSVTGVQTAVLSGHDDWVVSAAYSPDGKYIVTASKDGTARVWDANTGRQLGVLAGHSEYVMYASYSPDGARITTASSDNTARIWDAHSFAQVAVLSGHIQAVVSAVYSPDGKNILTGAMDKTARIWDATSGALVTTFSGHTDGVTYASYTPDGKGVLTSSRDRTVRIWDARIDRSLQVFSGHTDVVNSATYSPDGRRIASASLDRSARIWDANSGSQLVLIPSGRDWTFYAQFSPDGKRLVTAQLDKTARIWDATIGSEIATLSGHRGDVYSAVYSTDGTRIATTSADKTAKIWNADSAALLVTLSGHRDTVIRADFSPDGTRVVTPSLDKTARIWNAQTGAAIMILSGHSAGVESASYSPDGNRIVTSADDNTTKVWNAETGAELFTLFGHEGAVISAKYSPDGNTIVTASADKTARLWDARDGTQLGVLSGHSGQINSAAYSPDGQRIVTASDDKTIRIWSAAIAADLNTQILWDRAAQLDPLTEADRRQAGLQPSRDIKAWSSKVSDCDKAAAATYDPDRLAPGLDQIAIDADLANAACAQELIKSPNSVREIYQMGRALLAKHDFGGARREFELAVSRDYVAARIDLANLLLEPSAAMLDPARAISLYEKSWQDGLPAAAFFLARFYENGVTGSSPSGPDRTDVDLGRAWQWYQKGAEVDEPHANARLAERDEISAVAENDPLKKDSLLIGAFKLYALAAERATDDAWPDETWRPWRYRRASLARVLATRGKIREVGDTYLDVLMSGKSRITKIWDEIRSKMSL